MGLGGAGQDAVGWGGTGQGGARRTERNGMRRADTIRNEMK